MIPHIEPWFDKAEANALAEYMQGDGWLTEFKKTRELEAAIASYVGAKHCFMVPNATLALYAALKAIGVGPRPEVILPAFTMCATAHAVKMAGGKPVFVDVDKQLCLNLEQAERAITKRTHAIMSVAINGRAPDMQAVLALAKHRGLWLVEDAAQALGSSQGGQCLGTFGDAGIYSFSPQKIISMGQGGCIVTDDDSLAEVLRKFKNFGRGGGGSHDHQEYGINLKFTDLQAVVGLEQMKKLNWRVERKKWIYALYYELLSPLPEVTFFKTNLADTAPWYVDALVEDRSGLIDYLKACKVGTYPMYPVVPSLPPYNEAAELYPVAAQAAEHGLWFPSTPSLSDEDIRFVCDAVKRFYDLRKGV